MVCERVDVNVTNAVQVRGVQRRGGDDEASRFQKDGMNWGQVNRLSSSCRSLGLRRLRVSLVFVIMKNGMRAQRYGGNDRMVRRTVFVGLDDRRQFGDDIVTEKSSAHHNSLAG